MTVSGGVTEKFKDGGLVRTCISKGAIVAGQLVELNGTMTGGFAEVAAAGANSVAFKGVAMRSASGDGDLIAVAFPGSQVYMLKASGALNAGDYVKAGAAGTVVAIAADGDPRLIIGAVLQDVADTVTGEVVIF